jgi:hypothetical protein
VNFIKGKSFYKPSGSSGGASGSSYSAICSQVHEMVFSVNNCFKKHMLEKEKTTNWNFLNAKS